MKPKFEKKTSDSLLGGYEKMLCTMFYNFLQKNVGEDTL